MYKLHTVHVHIHEVHVVITYFKPSTNPAPTATMFCRGRNRACDTHVIHVTCVTQQCSAEVGKRRGGEERGEEGRGGEETQERGRGSGLGKESGRRREKEGEEREEP